jgi:hypothetical protein
MFFVTSGVILKPSSQFKKKILIYASKKYDQTDSSAPKCLPRFTKNIDLDLYNNLDKPFTTVCAVSISSQTSRPRPPNFLQADSKLDVEGRRHQKKLNKNFHEKFSELKKKKNIGENYIW